ncbi:DciA family protein [Patescibacteria group bacterium]
MAIQLNSLLNDSINRAGIKKQVDSVLILDKFIDVVDKIFREEVSDKIANQILKELKPLYFKNKILTLASLNPALSQEVKIMEKTILYRLNSEIGREVVNKIVFVME